jgi:hypothetical protein
MNRLRRNLVVVLGLILIGSVPAWATTTSPAARVQTLVRTGGRVNGFAQDGPRIAWTTQAGPAGHCVQTLHIRSLSTHRTLLTRLDRCPLSSEAPIQLALSGRAAVWDNDVAAGNTELDVDVWTAVGGARRARKVEHLHSTLPPGVYNPPDPPTAGARNLLVYDSEHEEAGAIRRIVSGQPRTLFAFDKPSALAIGVDGRIAVVRWEFDPNSGRSEAVGEVHRASGALVTSFATRGHPVDVALGPRLLALLTRSVGGAATITLFDASTGVPLHVVTVPAQSLLANGPIRRGRLIYSNGRRAIRALDTASLTSTRLAVTHVEPLGLSISGRRVTWVENLDPNAKHPQGTARIRALTVP